MLQDTSDTRFHQDKVRNKEQETRHRDTNNDQRRTTTEALKLRHKEAYTRLHAERCTRKDAWTYT